MEHAREQVFEQTIPAPQQALDGSPKRDFIVSPTSIRVDIVWEERAMRTRPLSKPLVGHPPQHGPQSIRFPVFVIPHLLQRRAHAHLSGRDPHRDDQVEARQLAIHAVIHDMQ